MYGKVREIIRVSGSTKPRLRFSYDAMDNRVKKEVFSPGQDYPVEVTYYVRDAQGNVLSVYEQVATPYTGGYSTETRLIEQPMYGSSRLGEHRPSLLVDATDHPYGLPSITETLGEEHNGTLKHLMVLEEQTKKIKQIPSPLGLMSQSALFNICTKQDIDFDAPGTQASSPNSSFN